MVPSSARSPPTPRDKGVPHGNAGAVYARLDRPYLGVGHDRDLHVGEAFDVPEEERGALLLWHQFERFLDDDERLAPGRDLGQVRSGRGRFSPGDFLIDRWLEGQLRPALPRADPVERAV